MSDSFYKQSEMALASAIDGEVVALHVDRGQCYGMREVAATVWNLLAKPLNLEGICNRLVEIYDVEMDVCRAEVTTLVSELQNEGLIEKVPPPPSLNAR